MSKSLLHTKHYRYGYGYNIIICILGFDIYIYNNKLTICRHLEMPIINLILYQLYSLTTPTYMRWSIIYIIQKHFQVVSSFSYSMYVHICSIDFLLSVIWLKISPKNQLHNTILVYWQYWLGPKVPSVCFQ